MRNLTTIIAVLAVTCLVSAASAQTVSVSFESVSFTSLGEGGSVGPFLRQGVQVTLESENQLGTNKRPLLMAEVASGVVMAFQNRANGGVLVDDLPDGGFSVGGNWSVTDRVGPTRDYIISFNKPVANVSFDLYDFRGDGPPSQGDPGDTVFVSVNGGANVPAYVLTGGEPDGNVVGISLPMNQISVIRLDFDVATFGTEGGTAIDNLMFTVPEPSTASLGLLSLLAIAGIAGRRNR